MRGKRFVAVSAIGSLVLSLLTQLTFMPTAQACTAVPEKPHVKLIWKDTGGPIFEVRPAIGGSLPSRIYYAYALKRSTDSEWGSFTPWEFNYPSTTESVITVEAPMSASNERISFTAYSYNNCGLSPQNQVTIDLVTSVELKAQTLDIAEDLPISIGKIPSRFLSPQGHKIPQTITSITPTICEYDALADEVKLIASGKCELRFSQNNDRLQTPNPDVTHALNILPKSTILPGVKKDRPDEIKGFQVHFIYVTLTDKVSSNFLESGLINNWLDLANAWLKRKIGKEFIFDTYQGAYDISILESKYKESELALSSSSPLKLLRAEFAQQNGSEMLGKNMFFIIDGKLSEDYCGLANQPGNTGLSTPGSDICWYPEYGFISSARKFNSPSSTIAHELIHNLGVGHPCENPSDLMYGKGCDLSKRSGEEVIDESNSLYVGADKAGANILDFKVWKDGSGKKYIPLREICYVGEPCMVSEGYWNSPQGNLTIQEKIGGKWRNIKTFKVKKIGARKYAFNASIIPTAAGIRTYRETLAPTKNFSAYIGKPFTRNVVY